MDKYEYKIRSEEIKELISKREYVKAAEIADTIDWRRVKSVMMLCTVSDLYKMNRRYEDSRDLLLFAYDRHPGGRSIVYALCELSIKIGEVPQAVEYCKEFVQIAPRDPGRYILQYKIYEAQGVSLEERIEVLEELKKFDYREKWAYELAYLYHRVGLASKCIDECDEMIIWFGDGKYVIKAMELKMLHQPLTEEQQRKYDRRFEVEEEPKAEKKVEESVIEEVVLPETEEPQEQDGQGSTVIWSGEDVKEASNAYGEILQETKRFPVEEIDIQVKTLDPNSQCNTINLQAEVAAGLRALLEEEGKENLAEAFQQDTAQMPVTEDEDATHIWNRAEVEKEALDVLEAKTTIWGKEQLTQEEEVAAEVVVQEMVSETAEAEDAEVFASEEPAAEDVLQENVTESAMEEAAEEIIAEEPAAEVVAEEKATEPLVEEEFTQDMTEEVAESGTAQEAEEVDQTAIEVMKQIQKENAEPPKEMAKVLSMEADGQISFIMPEKEKLEQQITGQLSIEDIMAEWERMKKDLEEKGREKVRQHVKENTGQMFTEFEASVRDGLLEQLEKGRTIESVLAEAEGKKVQEEPEVPVPPSLIEDEAEEEVSKEAAEEITEETETEVFEQEEISEETLEEAVFEESEEEAEQELTKETYEETEKLQEEFQTQEEEVTREIEDGSEEVTETEENPKGKSRDLTQEEKELFSPYIQGRSSKEQLVQAMDNISMAAYTGNLIITGAEGLDTIGLATGMIKDLRLTDSNFSGKSAKISGEALNKRDVDEVLKGLKNGALIIQKAGALNSDTAKALYKKLQQESSGLIIVLEGTKRSINALLEQNPILEECFTARIDMEALSDDALVAFCKKYAYENEFSIDEVAVLALHRVIANRQTNDHAVTVLEVKEIMDEAMESASRKNVGHFFDIITSKRYDEEDMIIIREKDFLYVEN